MSEPPAVAGGPSSGKKPSGKRGGIKAYFGEEKMFSNRRSTYLCSCLLIVLAVSIGFAQKDKDKKNKQIPADATNVLWQEPSDIASRNLFLGPGGDAMKPDLSRLTFLEAEPGGYSVKYRVRDAAGRTWVVKVGNEARPETTAGRLLWAAGY